MVSHLKKKQEADDIPKKLCRTNASWKYTSQAEFQLYRLEQVAESTGIYVNVNKTEYRCF